MMMPVNIFQKIIDRQIPADIVYEDDDLIVVNKPAGIVVHPAAGVSSGTLANALAFHFQKLSTAGGIVRPGIVHRLDKGGHLRGVGHRSGHRVSSRIVRLAYFLGCTEIYALALMFRPRSRPHAG